jgi:uncharacterized Zn finger protein
MSRNYYGGFPPYVSVAKKRAKAERKLKELRKKNPGIAPVVIEGRSIASTWWGKSWNENLERYADYSNRIGRGRSYVRHGAVLDLKIVAGKIQSLVQGSQGQPYKVEVSIKPLGKENWKKVREAAAGKLDSLGELLAGKFPKGLQELFFARGEGLFPEPKEIKFDCSCPDWASMCKHVAATLYGVGARLDEDPGLFFALRKIEMDDLITQAVKGTTRALLKKADSRSSRVMEDADLGDVFGIELDEEVGVSGKKGKKEKVGKGTVEKKKAKARKKATGKTRSPQKKAGKSVAQVKKKAARKVGPPKKRAAEKSVVQVEAKTAIRKMPPGKKKAVSRRQGSGKSGVVSRRVSATEGSFVDQVVAVVRRRQKVSIADICVRVDLSERQVRNAVARAVALGRLEKKERGVYSKPR